MPGSSTQNAAGIFVITVRHVRLKGDQVGGGDDHGPLCTGRSPQHVNGLPAFVHLGGENSARLHGRQAVPPASHALRPADPARRGQRGGMTGSADSSIGSSRDPVADAATFCRRKTAGMLMAAVTVGGEPLPTPRRRPMHGGTVPGPVPPKVSPQQTTAAAVPPHGSSVCSSAAPGELELRHLRP